jgi:hypothetical protein
MGSLFLQDLNVSTFTCVRDITGEPVKWLWPERVPLGAISIVEGDPGTNKSTLTWDIAARVSKGSIWPNGVGAAPCGGVLLIADEDVPGRIKQGLIAAGADLLRVHLAVQDAEQRFLLPSNLDELERAIHEHDVRLVILDPISMHIEGDAHRERAVRGALEPLARMAEKTDTAILLVRHLTKRSGGSALYRGGGSIALAAMARSVLVVAKSPVDSNERMLAHLKSNLGPLAQTLSFASCVKGNAAAIDWRGSLEVTAEQLAKVGGIDDAPALYEACYVVYSVLGDGPVLVTEATKAILNAGVAKRTCDRAKRLLGVGSIRRGYGPGSVWYWELPKQSDLRNRLHQLDLDELCDHLVNGTSPTQFCPMYRRNRRPDRSLVRPVDTSKPNWTTTMTMASGGSDNSGGGKHEAM